MKKGIEFLGIDLSNNDKANYLSRVFGIFYEGLIGFWLETQGFNLKGRPSVYNLNDHYLNKTFDYMVEKNRKNFIAEAKCYVAYQNFTQMELTTNLLDEYDDPSEKSAFQLFLKLGSKKEPYKNYKFYCKEYSETRIRPDGKILIWARLKKDEVKNIKKKYHFSYLFSVQEIITDMINEIKNKSKKGKEYYQYVQNRKNWTNELFKSLLRA